MLKNTVDRLRRHEGRYAEISRTSGVSYSTLVKLAQGVSDNPTVASLQQVIEALDAFEAGEAEGEAAASTGATFGAATTPDNPQSAEKGGLPWP